jgi:N-acetylmuramic acid 6-phosphate (MurNAc-6-P) etherase
VKVAIVMAKNGVGRDEAKKLLEAAGGFVRRAAGDPPPVTSL